MTAHQRSTPSSSVRGRTASPPRSPWPGPVARCGVYEAESTIGGGTRTEELTLPGFHHDVCSTIVSMLGTSPFMRSVDWAAHGVEVIHPDAPLAHPFDGGRAAMLERSLEATGAGLVRDGAAWRRLFGPLVRDVDAIAGEILGPIVHLPRHPIAMARFGPPALASARALARIAFREPDARALFAGLAAHAMLPLDRPLTAGFGLVLGLSVYACGWPWSVCVSCCCVFIYACKPLFFFKKKKKKKKKKIK